MFSHSQTKNVESNLISIHACNVFTDWKLKKKPLVKYDSSIFDVIGLH